MVHCIFCRNVRNLITLAFSTPIPTEKIQNFANFSLLIKIFPFNFPSYFSKNILARNVTSPYFQPKMNRKELINLSFLLFPFFSFHGKPLNRMVSQSRQARTIINPIEFYYHPDHFSSFERSTGKRNRMVEFTGVWRETKPEKCIVEMQLYK